MSVLVETGENPVLSRNCKVKAKPDTLDQEVICPEEGS